MSILTQVVNTTTFGIYRRAAYFRVISAVRSSTTSNFMLAVLTPMVVRIVSVNSSSFLLFVKTLVNARSRSSQTDEAKILTSSFFLVPRVRIR